MEKPYEYIVVRFNRPLLISNGFDDIDYKMVWGFFMHADDAYPDDIDSYIGYLALTHLCQDGGSFMKRVISGDGRTFFMGPSGDLFWSCTTDLRVAQDAVKQLGLTYYMYNVSDEALYLIDEECYEESWILNNGFFFQLERIIDKNYKKIYTTPCSDDLPF